MLSFLTTIFLKKWILLGGNRRMDPSRQKQRRYLTFSNSELTAPYAVVQRYISYTYHLLLFNSLKCVPICLHQLFKAPWGWKL